MKLIIKGICMRIDLTIETSNPTVEQIAIKSLHKTNDKIIAVWELQPRNSEYPHNISCTAHCYAFSLKDVNLPVVHYVIGKQDDIKYNKEVIKVGNESEISEMLNAATSVRINGVGSSSHSVSGTKPNGGFFSRYFPSLQFGGQTSSAVPALDEQQPTYRPR